MQRDAMQRDGAIREDHARLGASARPTRDALRATTAPRLLLERAASTPRTVAFRSKWRGLYRERTWADYARRVAITAKALQALGLKRGERIAIMGEACEEWLFCDLGAQSLGAIVYGIYPTAAPSEIAYQMRDGGASIFIAENQEYVDKVLAIGGGVPDLKAIVVIDDTAMAAYDDARLHRYADIASAADPGDLAWLEGVVAELQPRDPAFIVYTSGTTGDPKGALISHGKHLAATATVSDHYPTLYEKPHRTVAYLPLCHVLGRDVAVTLPLLTRLVPHFGEDVEDLPATLFETAPTVLFTVPRYLQKMAAQILVGIQNTSAIKRASYDLAARLARAQVKRRWDGTDSPVQGLAYAAARAVVLRPILNKLGCDKLELVISGGAPLSAETATLWQMLGVNVVEMYGQTETAGGIVAGQRGPFPRPGDVGEPVDGWDVRLADDGEVVVTSPDLFDGYWRNQEATRAVISSDGVLRTGDVGEFRDRRLRLIDRARDFIVTSGGKTVSPSTIENLLRASPYLAEAAVFGHARKYLTALVEVEYDMVADWARSHDVSYTGFTNLVQCPEVVAMIAGEVEKANVHLARVEQVKSFRILPKELDPEEEGEAVTATRKIKRRQMEERYRALIDSMYDDSEERLLAAGVGMPTTAP